MAKIAVVYWSGTGNTEMMAEEIAKQQALICSRRGFDAGTKPIQYLAFGCPPWVRRAGRGVFPCLTA